LFHFRNLPPRRVSVAPLIPGDGTRGNSLGRRVI
jgi:hypothetical protein